MRPSRRTERARGGRGAPLSLGSVRTVWPTSRGSTGPVTRGIMRRQSAASPGALPDEQRGERGEQREPHECVVPPCGQWGRSSPDCLPPLPQTLWTARSGSAGLPPQLPTAAEGPRRVPVGEAAILPQAHAAARQDRPPEAAETCVSGQPHGLGPMALPTVPGGKTHPPSRPSRRRGGPERRDG